MANQKVGVIGLGTIGTVHCDAYQASGRADIVAVCDIDQPKLKLKADTFHVPGRHVDYRALLADRNVQAVSICVPNRLHHEMAVAALKAGKNVLLEKPMCVNAQQAAHVVATAAKAKGILQIGMVNRQRPEMQILRQYIAKGLLGEIYHMRAVLIRRRGIPGLGGWFTTKKESGGGCIIDIAVHFLDACMWLSDQWKPTSISANNYAKFGPRMKNYRYVSMWAGPPKYEGVFDVEDYTTGLIRFGRKATLSFDISWAANSQDDAFVEILGDKGGARLLDEKGMTLYTEHEGHVADLTPQYSAKSNNFHVQAVKFLAACRGEYEPVATGKQGLVVMKVLDGIYASSAAGKEVAIKA